MSDLLAPPTVVDRTSLSRTTLWRLVRKGEFPPPVTISPGRIAWQESAVTAWVAEKIAAGRRKALADARRRRGMI